MWPGKVHDPSAIVIMRRVSVDRPELPHRGVEPMVLVPEIPNNKTDELLRREAVGERATPDHPDVGTGGETVHINGPLCTPTYAVGSAEWAEQQQGTPMLDPAMAEFAAEMRTNARLRRPRPAATRRAELIDNSSAPGAAELGRRIQAFWAAAGYDIRIEIVHSGGPHGSPVWGIRSGPT